MKFLILILALLIPLSAHAVWEVIPPLNATYSASATVFSPYATPTDLCEIGGVKDKIVKVFHVRVYGTQTTGGVNGFFLIKRSSYNSTVSTTIQQMTSVPHESYSPAAGADIIVSIGAQTLGTQVGVIRGADVFTAAPAGLGNSYFDFSFGPETGVQPVVLHQNEMLALNFGSAAVPSGMKISCEFMWSEQ